MNTLADLQDAFDELARRATVANDARTADANTAEDAEPMAGWEPDRAPRRSRRLAPLAAVAAVAAIAGGVAVVDANPWSDRSRTVKPGASDSAVQPDSLPPGMTPDDVTLVSCSADADGVHASGGITNHADKALVYGVFITVRHVASGQTAELIAGAAVAARATADWAADDPTPAGGGGGGPEAVDCQLSGLAGVGLPGASVPPLPSTDALARSLQSALGSRGSNAVTSERSGVMSGGGAIPDPAGVTHLYQYVTPSTSIAGTLSAYDRSGDYQLTAAYVSTNGPMSCASGALAFCSSSVPGVRKLPDGSFLQSTNVTMENGATGYGVLLSRSDGIVVELTLSGATGNDAAAGSEPPLTTQQLEDLVTSLTW